MANVNESACHNHHHKPNRFAVVPMAVRLNADPDYTGKGVTIAFLDSGFYPHADLQEPDDRILAYHDLAAERPSLSLHDPIESWQWHGTQTSVVAAGNGAHSEGVYRGLAADAELVLIKASTRGRIEEAISQGIVVVAAAGNSGAEGKHSIPPANSPSVITVGGYDDKNDLDPSTIDLYHSNFGPTADGTVKPEIIAPAMWVAAPILPGTKLYEKAETLSRVLAVPDYELGKLGRELAAKLQIPDQILRAGAGTTRAFLESVLSEQKIIAAHYQHVDGTSFAAPIVTSIVAQMIEANPKLTPAGIKNILISTAHRIAHASVLRQGYGVVDARQAVSLAKSDTHQWQAIVGGPPRVEDGKVLFFFYGDQAKSVSLAGEFNGWDSNKTRLQKDEQGMWRTAIAAPPPGLYHYKFVINDEWWLEDPTNGMKAPDGYGGLNSVLIIK